MFVNILIPLIISFLSFYLLPIWLYFLLSFITIIYFFFQLNQKTLNIHITEYIFSLIFFMILFWNKSDVRYLLIPIEGLLFIRIIIYNLNLFLKEDNSNSTDKEKTQTINQDDINSIENNIKEIITDSLGDLKTELSKNISTKLDEIQQEVYENNSNKNKELNEIMFFVDEKIKDGLNNISENIIKEDHIKNIVISEIENSDLKDNFTNNVIKKIQDGTLDPYNTKQIKNKDIKKIFIDTFNKAETEIDIISPWISNWIFEDKDLINGFKTALDNGVTIKILYGIGNTHSISNNIDKRSIYTEENALRLQRLFENSKGKLVLKRTNTHEKILLCDDKYMLIGSYNLLSFNGEYNGFDMRNECMQYQENKNNIEKLRKEYFDFN